MYIKTYQFVNFTERNIQIITDMFNAFKLVWMQVQRIENAVLYRQLLQRQSEAINITSRR
jgi:hypothetical protein